MSHMYLCVCVCRIETIAICVTRTSAQIKEKFRIIDQQYVHPFNKIVSKALGGKEKTHKGCTIQEQLQPMCNSGNKFQPKKVVKANVRLQLKFIDHFMYIEYKSNPSYT